MSRIFITGGTGCIGAATVHQLLARADAPIDQILIATRSSSHDRLQIWFGDSLASLIESGKISFASVDLGDSDSVRNLLAEFQPTHLIHLGALQSPDCAANPQLGLSINLAGTLKLFDTIKELQLPLQRFVFASSGAVYGKRATYDMPTIPENVPLSPPNLYGVWKAAGEYLAKLFHEQTGIPVVSLRLNTTYGPGRDQGTTSAPTKIIRSLAIGSVQGKTIPCTMPYQGRENYHYVEDVGAHFAGVCLLPFSGCQSFNIKGRTIEVAEFLETIRTVAAELGIADYLETGIDAAATPNLFICDLDDSAIEAQFPGLPRTDIADGIRKSLKHFLGT